MKRGGHWIAKLTGIYKITHKRSGKVYVGQSVDIMSRWKNHTNLNKKRGTHTLLQDDMVREGISAFSFEIIEECPRSELNEREKYWITEIGKDTTLYNKTKGGGMVRKGKEKGTRVTKKHVEALMEALEPLGKTLNQVFRELETHVKGSHYDKSYRALGIDDSLYSRWLESQGTPTLGDMSQIKIEKVTQAHPQSENS